MPEAQTNMDIRKNPEATTPVFEFTLPKHEIDADLKMGDHGEVIVPVEVVAVTGSDVTFRKVASARTDQKFGPTSSAEMREKMEVLAPEDMEGEDE